MKKRFWSQIIVYIIAMPVGFLWIYGPINKWGKLIGITEDEKLKWTVIFALIIFCLSALYLTSRRYIKKQLKAESDRKSEI